MMSGKEDMSELGRIEVLIKKSKMDIGIGEEIEGIKIEIVEGLWEILENIVRIIDRRRNEVRGLEEGIEENDEMIEWELIKMKVGGIVKEMRNIGRLGMKEKIEIKSEKVEEIMIIEDIEDRIERRRKEKGRVDERMKGWIMGDGEVIIIIKEGLRKE